MEWLEVKIVTDTEELEVLNNYIHELGIGGVVIEDPSTIESYIEDNKWDAYSEQLLDLSENIVVKCYLPMDNQVFDTLSAIKTFVQLHCEKTDESKVTTSQLSESDWENHWKQYFKPVEVAPNLIIKPPWESYEPKSKAVVVELDPGQAFGTGTHPTTAMCLNKITELIKTDDKVLDVGCGSGVLSITAAKHGAHDVIGLDVDSTAIRVAKQNLKLNNCENIKFIRGSLDDLDTLRADLVIVNIIADVILSILPNISRYIKEDGHLVLSGIILPRQKEVVESLNKNGYTIKDIDTDGDWVCITAQRWSDV
ncbi:50S ribosomal protein L11 methyltransferase [Proteinivorax hydrogeniformans]|uniref:Ribosomal protein L11 methyltransferase n=1 Tax=Proteinivorax hydrogeniformans TaxID=1826727 RepID=A0AAU8HWP9_9FIRM